MLLYYQPILLYNDLDFLSKVVKIHTILFKIIFFFFISSQQIIHKKTFLIFTTVLKFKFKVMFICKLKIKQVTKYVIFLIASMIIASISTHAVLFLDNKSYNEMQNYNPTFYAYNFNN